MLTEKENYDEANCTSYVMGCIGSHLAQLASGSGHVHRSRPNVFSVLNVDDMGRHLQPGKLEVKETDLVLYVNGKLAMTWPLRCLRRYGYDEDLFSFESGRRCPSGPGIYAFKCNRAQSLFNLLQAKIQGNPTSLPPVPSTPITPTALNPGGLSPTFDYVNITENQNMRGTTSSANYQDGNVIVHSSAAVINTSTSIPQSSPDNNHPLYMNVENQNQSGNVKNSTGTQSQGNQNGPGTRFNYSCNGTSFFSDYPGPVSSSNPSGAVSIASANNSVYYTNVDCSLMSTTTQTATSSSTFINNGNVSAEVNYAELDLETDSKITTTNSTTIAFNSVTKVSNPKKLRLSNLGGSMGEEKFRSKVKPQFSNSQDESMFSGGESSVYNTSGSAVADGNGGAPGDGYATIDFDRTAALSVVTRTKIKLDCNEENEVTVRKTHHNSIAL